MIPVTKPFLPPIDEYSELLKDLWDRNWLTNDGPLVKGLENSLCEFLGVKDLVYISNGTIGLQIALKTLNIKGDVITTPFSYVATTSSLVWEGCNPIFVDIESNTLNIDPYRIEEAITDKTTAILATHVFGNPCSIDLIENIANKYSLKVIYDAAHCFGVKFKDQSIFGFGDISVTSFHATKVFHTIEGGAIFSQSEEIISKASYMRNFGHDGPGKFSGVGINGKNSEFHAAMGLVNLKYISKIIDSRKRIFESYNEFLPSSEVHVPILRNEDVKHNYSYYPVLFRTNEICLKVLSKLTQNDIYPRRYFYPLLSELDYVIGKNTPIASDISTRILCLPTYYELTRYEIEKISRLILQVIG
jgi:dTDP-4-amino-4,6-dideoxygalactose transaminase